MTDFMRLSVMKIENFWWNCRDKKVFKLLKHAIKAVDNSLTHDIIQKLNPKEAELIKDPVFKTRLRFRFAGEDFPPFIVFKIYVQTNGKGIKYLCGKKVIKPASQAAVDSCTMMGNRKFLDQMMRDACEDQQHEITHQLDVINMKDYMKYVSNVDESSAESGGKANTWRKLTLEVLPRHHVISDVLLYLHHGVKTKKFIDSFQPHGFLIVPLTQTQQVEYINYLNKRKYVTSPNETSRHSNQAKERVAKMRKHYKSQQQQQQQEFYGHNIQPGDNNEPLPQNENKVDDNVRQRTSPPFSPIVENVDIDFDDDYWDEEGQMLFEWTRNLSLNNLASR